MKFSVFGAVIAVFMMATSAVAEEECRAPYEPQVPDRFETYDEAVEANKAVIKFIKDSEIYLNCLDFQRSKIDKDAEGSAEKEAAIVTAYNANVDSQMTLKNRFGAAYQKYKEENPG